MHKLTCCYKEKACDKCVIHADRKYRFTYFCRAILPITEPSDKLFALRDFVNLFVDIIVNNAYNGANARLL